MSNKDMTLDEFIDISEASCEKDNIWQVKIFYGEDGTEGILTIDNCYSEYEAKERSFLYLKNSITNKPKI